MRDRFGSGAALTAPKRDFRSAPLEGIGVAVIRAAKPSLESRGMNSRTWNGLPSGSMRRRSVRRRPGSKDEARSAPRKSGPRNCSSPSHSARRLNVCPPLRRRTCRLCCAIWLTRIITVWMLRAHAMSRLRAQERCGERGCDKSTRRTNHQKSVHPSREKYSASHVGQIGFTTPAILSHQRGVGHRRKRGAGSGGREGCD
jgi:hypothetical protein